MTPPHVMYLAVLPRYRQECFGLLKQHFGEGLQLFASDAHLDPTVKSGVNPALYTQVRMSRLQRRAFLQSGGWRVAMGAETVVVDLNPRSVTAWLLIAIRRLLRRRTIVWGHLHPRSGSNSSTAPLRRLMRRLAQGTITYTYTQREQARRELPTQPVWVAPNSLYLRSQMKLLTTRERNLVLYVGRFEPAKKVALIVEAFALHAKTVPDSGLVLVGEGSLEGELRRLVDERGITDRVSFLGPVNDAERLQELYASSFCSASPGFAGLGLTQSLGFGVPQLVSRDETHSPEIELAATGGVLFFETDSGKAMADGMTQLFRNRHQLPDLSAHEFVSTHYSAESMADGIAAALTNLIPEDSCDR